MILGVALLAGAAALSNTSPVMLLSDKQPLRFDENIPALPSMEYVFTNLVPEIVQHCSYDAYIFAKHDSVIESQINAQSMPFLSHVAQRAEGKFIVGTALESDSPVVDSTVSALKTGIADVCGAETITAKSDLDKPFDFYTDTKPRVISVEYKNKQASEVDESLKHIVGSLPSANFLVVYYSTPPKARDFAPKETAGSSPTEAPKDVLYESVFRNYQFFSPALFMGLIASVLFIVVFVLAFQSVDSMQISYAAFEPSREKKKQ